MIWIEIAGMMALLGAVAYWWRRRRRRNRLISLVALVREPVAIDPAVLAHVAGKAWNADLGDGSTEGTDGFVAGAGVMNMIKYAGRMFAINSFPSPYIEDVAKVAASIRDSRIRDLLQQHKAWFSCDALGADASTSDDEVLAWYRCSGPLFAELLDENCLLIFLPDSGLMFPINEDTETALRSDDPVRALRETLTLPIIQVSDDDPLMQAAVAQARAEWPKFVAAYEACAGTTFAVKAPLCHEDNTEYIWIEVTGLEGESVHGTIANEPGNLGSLKFGSIVSIPVATLNDWCYMDPEGNLVGGFTVEAVQKAMERNPTL